MAIAKAPSKAKTIEERLQAVEDEHEIVHTLNQYTHALDYGSEPSEFLDCFIETGVWRSTVEAKLAGSHGITLTGHRELAKWFVEHHPGRDKPDWSTNRAVTKHVYTGPEIRINGDRATVSSAMFTPGGGELGVSINTLGRYEDVLVRCPDGRWRFEERHLCREGARKEMQTKQVG